MSNIGRVLSVVSSWEGEGSLKGFWLRELTHPYFFLTDAGFAVDVASTRGGRPSVAALSDPRHPQTRERNDLISLGFLHDEAAAAKLEQTVALSDVDTGGYAAVHFVGGIGPVHDFVNNTDVKRITDEIWNSGGVVSAKGAPAIDRLIDSSTHDLTLAVNASGIEPGRILLASLPRLCPLRRAAREKAGAHHPPLTGCDRDEGSRSCKPVFATRSVLDHSLGRFLRRLRDITRSEGTGTLLRDRTSENASSRT